MEGVIFVGRDVRKNGSDRTPLAVPMVSRTPCWDKKWTSWLLFASHPLPFPPSVLAAVPWGQITATNWAFPEKALLPLSNRISISCFWYNPLLPPPLSTGWSALRQENMLCNLWTMRHACFWSRFQWVSQTASYDSMDFDRKWWKSRGAKISSVLFSARVAQNNIVAIWKLFPNWVKSIWIKIDVWVVLKGFSIKQSQKM